MPPVVQVPSSPTWHQAHHQDHDLSSSCQIRMALALATAWARFAAEDPSVTFWSVSFFVLIVVLLS
jgi:hypothetical protein